MTRGGGATASLRYDPLGRLYEVTGSSGARRFLYDGDDLVAEYNSSGTLLRRYVHGLGAGDDPRVWFEGSGVADAARRYLYSDERGSVSAVTDGVGNVLHINSYDEYGIPDSASIGTFGYIRFPFTTDRGGSAVRARGQQFRGHCQPRAAFLARPFSRCFNLERQSTGDLQEPPLGRPGRVAEPLEVS